MTSKCVDQSWFSWLSALVTFFDTFCHFSCYKKLKMFLKIVVPGDYLQTFSAPPEMKKVHLWTWSTMVKSRDHNTCADACTALYRSSFVPNLTAHMKQPFVLIFGFLTKDQGGASPFSFSADDCPRSPIWSWFATKTTWRGVDIIPTLFLGFDMSGHPKSDHTKGCRDRCQKSSKNLKFFKFFIKKCCFYDQTRAFFLRF